MIENPIRWHHLKAYGKAPVFAQAAMSGVEDEGTRAKGIGSAAHAMLFGTQPVAVYGKARNDKHAEYQAFKAEHPDALIVTQSEYWEAAGVAKAVQENKRAMELLAGRDVVREQTVIATIAGRLCRATPDARGPEGIVDLKSTRCASPTDFYFQAKRLAYFGCLAWYDRVCTAAERPFGPGRYFVAVEKGPRPYAQVYKLPADLCEQGDRQAGAWFEGLRNCLDSGSFPGYGPDEMMLEPPGEDFGLDWGAEAEAA
jgi:hypothetical protein